MESIKSETELVECVIVDPSPEPEQSQASPKTGSAKRKNYKPKRKAEEDGTSKAAKKSKKEAQAEKYKIFAEQNYKSLTTEFSIVPEGLFESFKHQLTSPSYIKCYLLPLFYFLDTYRIIIKQVFEFENVCIVTPCGENKLNELKRLRDEHALPAETMELFERKYGKKMWKVPKKDLSRIKSLLDTKGVAHCNLINIEESSFENDQGQIVTCLIPKLRYD